MNKLWIGLGAAVGLAVLSLAGFFIIRNQSGYQAATPNEQQTEAPSPTPAPSGIFSQVTKWKPDVTWSAPKMVKEQTAVGNYTGYQSAAEITATSASVLPFEDKSYLKSQGFLEENMFAASGPGSNIWGYTNKNTGEAIIFGYKTIPTSANPNEPLQFNCPCKLKLTTFIGMPVES